MREYEFKLTPAFCLFNGVGIKNQKGKDITFLLENPDNSNLQKSLTKAFLNHLEYIRQLQEYPEVFKGCENINFEKTTRTELRKFVSSLYEESYAIPVYENKNEIEEEREAAAVLLLDTILSEAKKLDATDIHIDKTQIRYRVQGNLISGMKLENEKAIELVRRIKLLSGLNVLETKKSQDGQFSVENVFIRVSTMSVVSNGYNSADESVVLRLLDISRVPLSISKLGFNIQQLDVLQNMLELKNGLILICGPTGSGKSTTAASFLLELYYRSNNQKKIISLEEPPEFFLPGITQIKIDSQDNSYSNALQHIFRQDPDVLMIGEIRDRESCETAIMASLTGHLVIATLHTDNVIDSFYRLENFGIDSKILVSVIRGIILQEMNHFDGKVNLLADIAIPNKNITQLYSPKINVSDFDDLFTHYSNIGLVLSKTVGSKSATDNSKSKKLVSVARRKNKTKQINPIINIPAVEEIQKDA